MGPPGAPRWGVLGSLVDCPRHVERRGGRRAWDSGRSAWLRCVRCCGRGLRGIGLRKVAERAGVDRKTARRYVEAAAGRRAGREGRCRAVSDELVGVVVEAVRPARPERARRVVGGAARTRGADPRLGAGARSTGRSRTVVDREDRGAAGPPGGAWCRSGRCTGSRWSAAASGLGTTTVRVVDGEPGVECQIDFARIGLLLRPGDRAAAAGARADLHRGGMRGTCSCG